MNVSFLSSTGTFGGLQYNAKKVEMNTADLIYTQNFDGLKHLSEVSMRDYLDYFKAWSERNSRVKNAQFHVAISVKGKEKSAEEILKISKEWLSEMGYKEVPALFFFHRDTDNNHIHIISSRVDKDGKKIKDNNEIRRGLSLIRKLNGVDLSAKAREDFMKLQGYLISDKSQLSSLWGSLGYRVKMNGEQISIHKEGHLVLRMGVDSLEHQINKDILTQERASEIRGLMAEYRRKVSIEELKVLLKDKHGLELYFQGKKDNPYGYAIIDHQMSRVYKGSEVLPIKELLSKQRIFSDKEQVERVNNFAQLYLEKNRATSKEFAQIVRQWGLDVYRGEIKYRRSTIGLLDENVLQKLQYNDRLEKAAQFDAKSLDELEALGKHYNVLPYDIEVKVSDATQEMDNEYLKSLYSEARDSGDFYGVLSSNGIAMIASEGKYYLLDEANGHIEEVDSYKQNENYSRGAGGGYAIHSDAGDAAISLLNLDVYDDINTSSVDNSLKKRRRGR